MHILFKSVFNWGVIAIFLGFGVNAASAPEGIMRLSDSRSVIDLARNTSNKTLSEPWRRSSANRVPIIHVRDDRGNQLRLNKPAARIVALAPHIVENLFSAGAGNKIVAAVDYSDYPLAAQKILSLGGAGAISIEAIVALAPDLVIAWPVGRGQQISTSLRRLGITVYDDSPHDLEGIAHSITQFGLLAGTEKTAQHAAQQYLQDLSELAIHRDEPQVSVFYQIWNQPLQTLNDQSVISDVIHLCGGSNSFGRATGLAPKVSVESVLAVDPQVIIASAGHQNRKAWLDAWRQWPSLQAVKNSYLYAIEPDYLQRHTVRILYGAQLMCDYLAIVRSKDAQ